MDNTASFTMTSKRFKWTNEHERLMLREVLASEIWTTKAGSSERREEWKKIVEALLQIEKPKFDVSVRSVREHFQAIFARRKSKNREEVAASGINPEPSESDVMLDELIELFETATTTHLATAKEAKEKEKTELAKAEEMRRQSVETLGESRKRKAGEERELEHKKRNPGKKTFEIIEQKIKFDAEMKEKELLLREKEMEQKAKHREILLEEQRKREREKDRVWLMLEQMNRKIDQQGQMLQNLMASQNRQETLIESLLKQVNGKQ